MIPKAVYAGDLLFSQGEVATDIYFVTKGEF